MSIAPEVPFEAVPVESVMAPDTPTAPASALSMTTCPDVVPALVPEVKKSPPPVPLLA